MQPPLFSALARQLLHVLKAHEAAATFQAAALQLVQAHGGSGEGGGRKAGGMPTPQASMLVAEAAASLQALAELLAKPLDGSRRGGASSGGGAAGAAGAGAGVPPSHAAACAEPLPTLLDAVAARRVLPLLAALLHVPAAHRAALEAAAPAAPAAAAAAAQQAAVLAAAMAQQVGGGSKALLTVLASSRGGRRLLLGDASVLEQLLLGTDAGCLAAGHVAPGAEGASLLQHLAVAEATAAQLCDAPLDSEAFAAASDTAAALLHESGPTGRLALVQALALRAAAAVPRLLLMLRMHCALLRAACGTGAAACPEPGGGDAAAQLAALQRQYEPECGLLLASAPACAPAAQLLLALLGGCHPGALAAWQQHAVSVQIAAAAELRQLAALPPAAAVVGGLGGARAALASMQGALAAVVTAQREGGLTSLLTFLGAELPQLGAPGGARRTGARTVRWQDVELLFW